jgi:hypothetical protein
MPLDSYMVKWGNSLSEVSRKIHLYIIGLQINNTDDVRLKLPGIALPRPVRLSTSIRARRGVSTRLPRKRVGHLLCAPLKCMGGLKSFRDSGCARHSLLSPLGNPLSVPGDISTIRLRNT